MLPLAVWLIGSACGEPTEPPVDTDEWRPVSIVSGNGFSCALGADGTVYCWGANQLGQLGRSAATSVEPIGLVQGGVRFEALAAGDANVCGLSGGTAYCWGSARLLGGTQAYTLPTPVPPYDATYSSISVGGRHACALRSAGGAVCWGDNTVLGGGQLGDGTDISQFQATPVDGQHAFDELVAGFLHTCGRAGTEIWCWGSNYDGALGVETSTISSLVPQLVALNEPAQRIAVGAGFSCIEAAAVHCWGTNRTGQLGIGSTEQRRSTASAIDVGTTLADVRMAAVNRVSTHACALDDTGRSWCWGANDFGQLGRHAAGTCDEDVVAPISCDRSPGTVEASLVFDAVAPGATHTCALAGEEIYCWGANERGELGAGPGSASQMPVRVTVPD
ncbi:MAG TPA: hypothetical protein VFZ24_06230 [Longimicrobiales bacterium]